MKAETFTCDLCRNQIEQFGLGHKGSGIVYSKRQLRLTLCSDPAATAHICRACEGQIAEQKRKADENDCY